MKLFKSNKIQTKEDLILNFIKQFRDLGAKNVFSNGMCYWFAHILSNRFNEEGPEVVYDEIENHFGCEINGEVYDITGEVTDKYDWTYWYKMPVRDRALHWRILRDCRDKVPADVLIGGYCPHGHYDDFGTMICAKDNHPCGWNELCIFEEDT